MVAASEKPRAGSGGSAGRVPDTMLEITPGKGLTPTQSWFLQQWQVAGRNDWGRIWESAQEIAYRWSCGNNSSQQHDHHFVPVTELLHHLQLPPPPPAVNSTASTSPSTFCAVTNAVRSHCHRQPPLPYVSHTVVERVSKLYYSWMWPLEYLHFSINRTFSPGLTALVLT